MGYPGLWMCGLIGFILFTIRTDGLSSGLPGFWMKKARQAESVGQVTSSSAPDRIILSSSLSAAFSRYLGVGMGTRALYFGRSSCPGFNVIFTGSILSLSSGSKSSLNTSGNCLSSLFHR